MNRTTVTIAATLVALILLAATSVAGFTAAPILQQNGQPLDVNVWLAATGSTEPVRRLAPGTTDAQIVLESNRRDQDPSNFRVDLTDAYGNRVFQSGTLTLPTGPNTETVDVSGNDLFDAYVSCVETWNPRLVDAVDEAVSTAQGSNPSASQVRDRIQDVMAAQQPLSGCVERLLAFDLSSDGDAEASLTTAETQLNAVSDRGTEALDLLGEDPINWNDVRGKLDAMQTATTGASSEADAGLGALDGEAEREFPPTGIAGRCNQNTVQLRVAGSESISDDYWWTVGTPGSVAVLANPQDPTSTGILSPGSSRLFSLGVSVAGAPHSTVVQALAIDDLCLPVEGATVNFSTPAGSIVTLDQSAVTTDANGVASVTANSTNQLGETGTAAVNAASGSATASTTLTVVGPPDKVNLLLGGSEASRIPNYGVESTIQVTAEVKDTHDFDVADGTVVNFSIDPTDHHVFSDDQVTTASGQASATLVFGQTTGPFSVDVQAGSASDSQDIRVVGRPDTVNVTAQPSIIPVNRVSVDDRSSTLTVTVRDSEGNWAPDSTMVEFEFVDPADANWAYFTLRPDNLGQYRTPITDGVATTQLVGSPTNLQDPSQTLSYREVTVRVTAVYEVGGVETSVSDTVTVTLRGQTIFLPLIRRSGG